MTNNKPLFFVPSARFEEQLTYNNTHILADCEDVIVDSLIICDDIFAPSSIMMEVLEALWDGFEFAHDRVVPNNKFTGDIAFPKLYPAKGSEQPDWVAPWMGIRFDIHTNRQGGYYVAWTQIKSVDPEYWEGATVEEYRERYHGMYDNVVTWNCLPHVKNIIDPDWEDALYR